MFSGQHRNTVSREAGIQHDGRDLHLLAACQGREPSGTTFSPWSPRWKLDTTNGVRTICALVHAYVYFYNVDRIRVYTASTMAQ